MVKRSPCSPMLYFRRLTECPCVFNEMKEAKRRKVIHCLKPCIELEVNDSKSISQNT